MTCGLSRPSNPAVVNMSAIIRIVLRYVGKRSKRRRQHCFASLPSLRRHRRDDTALYVLVMPEAGPTLKWMATIPITAQGLSFAWDPRDRTGLYALNKQGREVIVGRAQAPAAAAGERKNR